MFVIGGSHVAQAKFDLHRSYPNNKDWPKCKVSVYFFKGDQKNLSTDIVHLVGILAEAHNDAVHIVRETLWFERVQYARKRYKLQGVLDNDTRNEVKNSI